MRSGCLPGSFVGAGMMLALLRVSLAAQTPAFIGTNFPVGGSVAAGDFNGDGKPDLAAAGVGLAILLGNGDGNLSTSSHVSGGKSDHVRGWRL